MLIDIHVHSNNSENVPFSIEQVIAQAKQNGLDGICLTDTHSLAGLAEAKRLGAEADLVVLLGFEALTDCGHFLAFLPEPEGLDISSLLQFDDQGRASYKYLADQVERLGGVIIAAHPYDRSTEESPGDSIVQLKGISAVEVLNASRTSMANELAEEVAAGSGLPGVGGSDARESLDLFGKVATLFGKQLQNEADLIACIKSFDVWPVSLGKPAIGMTPHRSGNRTSGRDRPPRRDNDSRSPRRSSRPPRRGPKKSSR